MSAIHQYRINQTVALRAVASATKQADRSRIIRPVTPQLRQAVVVTVDSTTPPSCTVQYDTVTPGPTHPLTRYATGLTLAANDLVYVAILGNGDAWVLTKMAATATATQRGTASFTFTVANATTVTVVWPSQFTAAPVVLHAVQIGSNLDVFSNMSAVSVTQATFRIVQKAGTAINGTGALHWEATGILA